jgi:hypothetical protein
LAESEIVKIGHLWERFSPKMVPSVYATLIDKPVTNTKKMGMIHSSLNLAEENRSVSPPPSMCIAGTDLATKRMQPLKREAME